MRKYNKRILVFLLSWCVAATAMQTPTNTPPWKKEESTKNLSTPEAIEKYNADKKVTPVSASENFAIGARITKNRKNRRRCLAFSYEKLRDTVSQLAARAQQIAKIIGDGQEIIAADMNCQVKPLPGSSKFHREFIKKSQGNMLTPVFIGFGKIDAATSSGVIFNANVVRNPISVEHIVDGDKNGGKHFLTSQSYGDFRNETNAAGITIEKNMFTGVEHGAVATLNPNVPFRKKTIVNLSDLGLGEDDVVCAINDVLAQPIAHCASRVFGIANGIPLEICLKDNLVATAYPIYSYAQWQPSQPSICVAPISCNGSDKSIFMSSEDLLSLATSILSNHDPSNSYNPIRYRTQNTIIVDLAKNLSATIEAGIFVEFPIDQFDLAMLKTNFPGNFV